MFFPIVLTILLPIVFGCTTEKPKWSNIYTVKGTLFFIKVDIQEPFVMWYDKPSHQARLDYFDGMSKMFYKANEGLFGNSYHIFPITTEEMKNKKIYSQNDGTSMEPITLPNLLPNLYSFECKGEETVGSFICERWERNEEDIKSRIEVVMWLYYRYDKLTGEKKPVPVKYEKREYDLNSGQLNDHISVEIDYYDDEKISSDVFKLNYDLFQDTPEYLKQSSIYAIDPIMEIFGSNETHYVNNEFNKFMDKHRVKYDSYDEHSYRKNIFKQNLRYINSINRQNKGYTLKVNHLADKTQEEHKYLRGRLQSNGEYNGGLPFEYNIKDLNNVPKQFDWRLHGAVSPVKNQHMCGSCWSFSTVGTIEGAYFLKYKKLLTFSEQALIDCSWGFGNLGCSGGLDTLAYKWIMKHGLPTVEAYGSYIGMNGYCHAFETPKTANITGYVNVTTNDPDALKLAIFNHGPVSVAIDAGQRSFTFYSNGILYDPECGQKPDELNHAVLAVGYGTMNGEDYWLLKNSWSPYWGLDGYVLLSTKDNNCGTLTQPTYVTL